MNWRARQTVPRGDPVVEALVRDADRQAQQLAGWVRFAFGLAIGALNRSLVEAGCVVSEIVPRRRDLGALFQALVEEEARA